MAAATKDRETFCIAIGMELGHSMNVEQAAEFARFLLRSAVTLQRYAEMLTEMNVGTRAVECLRAKREILQAHVRRQCAPHGIDVEFGSDVRGGSLFLKLPSGRYNDLGGRGWSVPR